MITPPCKWNIGIRLIEDEIAAENASYLSPRISTPSSFNFGITKEKDFICSDIEAATSKVDLTSIPEFTSHIFTSLNFLI